MKPANTPSIISVMLNWNELHFTVPCIDSLRKSTLPLRNIIVVDQCSEDGSGEKLEQMYSNDDQICILRNDKNVGFANGMNIGIRKALDLGAEMVFILNNDTDLAEDCIEKLHTALAANEHSGAAGPAIMYHSNPDKIWQAGGYFNKVKMGISVPLKSKLYSSIDKNIQSVGFLTGCAILIPSRTLHKVGAFDPLFFIYAEDAEYSLRIKEAGMDLLLVPEAKMWHKIEDVAVDRTSPFVLYHLARGTIILLRKRFRGIQKLYGLILQFTLYSAFRILQTAKGRKGWSSLTAWFKGLSHGILLDFKR